MSGKSKDEQMAEKKQELEKRLQDVTGQLGSGKKSAKKGKEWKERPLVDFVINHIVCLSLLPSTEGGSKVDPTPAGNLSSSSSSTDSSSSSSSDSSSSDSSDSEAG